MERIRLNRAELEKACEAHFNHVKSRTPGLERWVTAGLEGVMNKQLMESFFAAGAAWMEDLIIARQKANDEKTPGQAEG